MKLTNTATRVAESTSPEINQGYRTRAQRRLEKIRRGDAATWRLQELEHEWDIERAIETEAPLMILMGVVLGVAVDRRLLGLSGVAAGMLLLHSLQGWYPLLPLFRRGGLRTSREIADEAFQIRLERGDFDGLEGDARQRALAAFDAAATRSPT